jgi:hypothetical protein
MPHGELISLEKTMADERRDREAGSLIKPEYPDGLKLKMGPEVMERVGMEKTLDVGTKVPIYVMAEVVEVGVDEQGRPKMELQITDMEIKKSNDEEKFYK